MDSSKPDSFFLRSSSAVSLHERFSQVLVDQLTRSRMVTFNPGVLQQRRPCGGSHVCLQTGDSVRVGQRVRRSSRRSVWTRLGWQQVTRRLSVSRPKGFWSFRHKYRWRAGTTSTYRRRVHLHSRLRQRRLLTRRNIQKLTAGRTQRSLHLQRGGAAAFRGRGLIDADVPTKKQLDAQLEEYMSMSRSRLDKQLDNYMSTSKRRLDAQLDEYMLMAGQTDLQWD